jgi:hypothetical protein
LEEGFRQLLRQSNPCIRGARWSIDTFSTPVASAIYHASLAWDKSADAVGALSAKPWHPLTIQDCARKVCRKDIMSTVANRATNRSLSECSMNTTDTFSPFWARVCTIIKQAVGIWPAGAQRDALAALSQDIQAIEIYAGNIADGETAANVAGRIITKFLYRL